jgi:hypothetical protein
MAQLVAAQERQAPLDGGPRFDVRQYGGDLALISVACLASAVSWSTIYTGFNLFVILTTVTALLVVVATRTVFSRPHWWSLVIAVGVGIFPQIWRSPNGNVVKTAIFPWSIGIGVAACAILILAIVLRGKWQPRLIALAMVTMSVSCLLIIIGSPVAEIDVWVIFQQSADGLLQGLNPYTQYFQGVPAGQTADCFNYLPATFLLASPSKWLFGDVRYGEMAILLGGYATLAVTMWRMAVARGGAVLKQNLLPALLLVAVALTLPGILRVVHQGWNESLVLGCLLIAIALLLKDKAWWAVIPLALAVATKQHVALILPLWALWPAFGWKRTLGAIGGAVALSLPWIAADFGRFYHCTVEFFVDLPARADSLSVWKFIPESLQTVSVLALTALAFVLVLTRIERSLAGLVLGSAIVMIGFDLANKQSFENQWWIASSLIIVSMALARFLPRSGPAEVEPPELTKELALTER